MAEIRRKTTDELARDLFDYFSKQRIEKSGTITPSRIAARESGAIGAASIASQIANINKAPLSMPTVATTETTPPPPGLYYNYYTGEYVDDPSKIVPRTGMGGAESGGGTILVTEEDYKNAGSDSFGKTVTSVTYEGTGKNRIKITKYSDGTESREPAPESGGRTIKSTYTDPTTGDVIAVYDDGTTEILSKGTKASDAAKAAAAAAAAANAERKSAYDLLYQQFAKYGLQALVTPLEGLIKEGVPASEFAIRLRETDAYQKRFAANKTRINKGLAALSEAEYIGLEDAYQGIMRQYGMPESYYARGEMGRQEGFEKFIGGDVSPAELETRISTAYNRVINTNPEVVEALKQFYPNITNGDILSYALDPDKALTDINKKVTAAEIGGAAIGAGLGIGMARAEELGAFGVSKAQAQQGYQTISDLLPTATKLSSIYAKQGLGEYNQAVAEQEVFGISGAATAAQKRRKLTELETAQFSGQTGVGALARERAGQF